jgi:hypothetical protein
MARIHGRNGRVYLALASGGTAEPVADLNSWSMNFVVNKAEVTSFGDSNLVYVAGLPDASGDFSGFYDDATTQSYTAATDGISRRMYLYPNTNNATQYWFGNVLPDFAVDGAVGGSVNVKATWNAATAIIKQG